jgi:hypothetical protein
MQPMHFMYHHMHRRSVRPRVQFFIILIANCNTVAVLSMIGAFTDAFDAGKLVELHVPKVNWASTVALVFRDGETLSPDARLLRDAAQAALTESST